MAKTTKPKAKFRFPIPERILKKDVTEIDFDTRAMNIIKRKKWETIEDVMDGIKSAPVGLGTTSIKNIKNKIINYMFASMDDAQVEKYECDLFIRRVADEG